MHEFLNSSMKKLKKESDTCNSKSMALSRRIEEMEKQIGVEACVDELTGKSLI